MQIMKFVLTENGCPAIRGRLDVLDRTSFPSPSRDLIILHPMVYWISVDFEAGSMHPRLQEDDHPLVTWALEPFALWRSAVHKSCPRTNRRTQA